MVYFLVHAFPGRTRLFYHHYRTSFYLEPAAGSNSFSMDWFSISTYECGRSSRLWHGSRYMGA